MKTIQIKAIYKDWEFVPRLFNLETKYLWLPSGLHVRFDEVTLLAWFGKLDAQGKKVWEQIEVV